MSTGELLSAVEFFSGIGAFAEAVRGCQSFVAADGFKELAADSQVSRHIAQPDWAESDKDPRFRSSSIKIIAAFDQNNDANETYLLNFGLRPISRNLDSIKQNDIPAASAWWLSPPCTPFSRRGKQLDVEDTRAAAFLHLVAMLPHHLPELFMLENVEGFVDSKGEEILFDTLSGCGYKYSRTHLCPSLFGIPSRRPRVFYVASLSERFNVEIDPLSHRSTPVKDLSDYLDTVVSSETLVEQSVQDRYEHGFDVIESPGGAQTICFTSGYARSMKVGGSYLRMENGGLRRFSPGEIIRLLGFSKLFAFPESIPMRSRWRLAGNSVDITCIRFLLEQIGIA